MKIINTNTNNNCDQEQKNLQSKRINDLMVEPECQELSANHDRLIESFNDPLKRLKCLEQSVQIACNNLEEMSKLIVIKTHIIQQKLMRMKVALETIDKYDNNGDDNHNNRSNDIRKLFKTKYQFQVQKFSSNSNSQQ